MMDPPSEAAFVPLAAHCSLLGGILKHTDAWVLFLGLFDLSDLA